MNIQKLLLPFAVLFDGVTRVRNYAYKAGWLKSESFDIPVIVIGNLRVGGTGKTPHVEFFLKKLSEKYQIAVLSRGYGRKTKGFIKLSDKDTAKTVGDEPWQMFQKYKSQVGFFVCENRVEGIKSLLKELHSTEMVLLDDAYQHRRLRPKLKVLLSPYSDPFYEDFILPAGYLRESRNFAQEAQVIIVTQCPLDLDDSLKEIILNKISRYNKYAAIYFSHYSYQDPYRLNNTEEQLKELPETACLLSGIARPDNFEKFFTERGIHIAQHLKVRDHQEFSRVKILPLIAQDTPIFTTEKDATRLKAILSSEEQQKLWVLPIAVEIQENENELLKTFKDAF